MPIKQHADAEAGLRHQLSAAQMAMVSVGGSVGTGLLLGSFFWVVNFAALLLFINLRPVGDYGSSEFWFAMIKVVTIVVSYWPVPHCF